MKFTVFYKHSDEVERYFFEKRGKNYGDGINLMELGESTVLDKNTGKEFLVYAFHCKASVLKYLKHKLQYGKYATHQIGWK